MAEDRKLLFTTAIKPTIITIVAYNLIKCAYYAVFHSEYLFPRAVASTAGIILTLVFLIPNLSRRQMACIIPVGAILIELLVIPFVDYDRLIYFCIIGCTLLSLLFIDVVGLLITVGVSWAALSVYLFVFERSLVNGTVMRDDIIYFAGVVFVDIVIIHMCKFSVSVLDRSRRGVEAALDEAREANRAKNEFLVAMSHEIRTPMNAISGMAELALHEDISGVAREHVRTIRQEACNLLSAVDHIFDPSKIDRLRAEDVDMFGKFDAEPESPLRTDARNIPEITVPKFRAPEARALVTDDIRTNLEVANGLLSLYEIQTETCLSGAEAIEAIRNNRYDLVFMDHMMPEMDGIETTRRIREMACEDPRFKSLPIIALTANTVADVRDTFLQNGFDDFLSKPIDTDKLAAILDTWIPNEKKMPVEENANINNEIESGDAIVIDGVDVKLGIARTGGTLGGYLKTLEIFCGDGREKIEEIKKSMFANDLQLYTTYIHALKSAAANIGAIRLSEAAKVLEAAGKRGDMAFINKHTARVMADLVLILHNADKTIAEQAEKRLRPQAEIDKNALNGVLTRLKNAIDDMDPAEINAAVKELVDKFGSAAEEDVRVKVKNISRDILNGGYDAAVETIDSLFTLTANTPQ